MKMKRDSKLLKISSKLILTENGTLLMDNIKIDEIPKSNESIKNTPLFTLYFKFFDGTSYKNL